MPIISSRLSRPDCCLISESSVVQHFGRAGILAGNVLAGPLMGAGEVVALDGHVVRFGNNALWWRRCVDGDWKGSLGLGAGNCCAASAVGRRCFSRCPTSPPAITTAIASGPLTPRVPAISFPYERPATSPGFDAAICCATAGIIWPSCSSNCACNLVCSDSTRLLASVATPDTSSCVANLLVSIDGSSARFA